MRASTTSRCARRRSTTPRRRRPSCAGARSRSPRRRPISSKASSPSAAAATPPTQTGMAVHVYAANRSMTDRYFYNADGEMLIVPQQGRAALRHRARRARGGDRRDRADPARPALPRRAAGRPVARLHLRELRRRCSACPSSARLGSNGLANPRDFLAPVAAYRDEGDAVPRWSPSSRAICGRRRWRIRRSTSSPGTATSRPTSTTSRASW